MRILAINSGSSSLKAALYEMNNLEKLLVALEVRRIGIPGGGIRALDAKGKTLFDREVNVPDHVAALHAVLKWLCGKNHETHAVGHRSP